MTTLLLLPLILASLGRSLDVEIRPGADHFSATVSGSAAGLSEGPFRGALALNGSPAQVAVSGEARKTGDRWRLPVTLRFAEIPADWANRFRPGAFDYFLRGTVSGGVPVEWRGTKRWDAVEVEGDRGVASRFLKLRAVEVTKFSLFESEARALLAVRNPFSFPLKLARTQYRFWANGREVGSGDTSGLLLRELQTNELSLPVDLDHGELLAAAGRALLSRGAVEGRLTGTLTIRLPGGDVAVPLDLSSGLSLTR